jgi:hypothetical protein
MDEIGERRLLIEQSPKPFGAVVTYYPQNCRHQLCEPNDILGGEDLPAEIRQAAKQIQEATASQPTGSDPTEDIETAKSFSELKNLLEERRRRIKAKATVSDFEYDAMGGSSNRSVASESGSEKRAVKAISEDWPEGKPASQKQIWWMMHNGIPNAQKIPLTSWRAVVIRNLIELGVKPDTALSYGRRQALAVEAKLKGKAG